MYDNSGAQPGVSRPPANPLRSPFGNAFNGASSGLIRGGLGAYGEKILGSSSDSMQSNLSPVFIEIFKLVEVLWLTSGKVFGIEIFSFTMAQSQGNKPVPTAQIHPPVQGNEEQIFAESAEDLEKIERILQIGISNRFFLTVRGCQPPQFYHFLEFLRSKTDQDALVLLSQQEPLAGRGGDSFTPQEGAKDAEKEECLDAIRVQHLPSGAYVPMMNAEFNRTCCDELGAPVSLPVPGGLQGGANVKGAHRVPPSQQERNIFNQAIIGYEQGSPVGEESHRSQAGSHTDEERGIDITAQQHPAHAGLRLHQTVTCREMRDWWEASWKYSGSGCSADALKLLCDARYDLPGRLLKDCFTQNGVREALPLPDALQVPDGPDKLHDFQEALRKFGEGRTLGHRVVMLDALEQTALSPLYNVLPSLSAEHLWSCFSCFRYTVVRASMDWILLWDEIKGACVIEDLDWNKFNRDTLIERVFMTDDGGVFSFDGMVPSGSPWTCFLDTVLNILYMKAALLCMRFTEKEAVPKCCEDNNLRLFFQDPGDTAILGLRRRLNEWFQTGIDVEDFIITCPPFHATTEQACFPPGTDLRGSRRWRFHFYGMLKFLSGYWLPTGLPIRPAHLNLEKLLVPEAVHADLEDYEAAVLSMVLDNPFNHHNINHLKHRPDEDEEVPFPKVAHWRRGRGCVDLDRFEESVIGIDGSSSHIPEDQDSDFSIENFMGVPAEDTISESSYPGHWTRITKPVGGRLSYKPPIYDINKPDLYIPFMAFGTFVVLAGFSLGLRGR
ncbi:Yif1 family [Dillenia turbinata]|uniref:Yif1 family n=1 Tax=Dillenia turbinata TaxID=194707 RepID=A0AAN8VAE2_9MAGN